MQSIFMYAEALLIYNIYKTLRCVSLSFVILKNQKHDSAERSLYSGI